MRKDDYKEGDKVGGLIFIERVKVVGSKHPCAKFSCSCGNIFVCIVAYAKKLKTKSCGCKRYFWQQDGYSKIKEVEYVGGNVKRMPPMTKMQSDRFWGKVAITENKEDCWYWTAPVSVNDRYGSFGVGNGVYKSNRISYFLHYGEDPENLKVLHKCNNSLCCNPNHLYLGTQYDNAHDKIKAGRQPIGVDAPTSKLSENDIIEIRRKYSENGLSIRKLGKQYGVVHSNIGAIVRRETWKHIQ